MPPVTQPEDAQAEEPTEMELAVLEKLKARFEGADIDVMDVSGARAPLCCLCSPSFSAQGDAAAHLRYPSQRQSARG
jgi:hypothetical protein